MIRLGVRVERARAELILAELLELAPAGVEEVSVDERTVEYAVYGAPGELPGLPDLRVAAGGSLVDVSTSELPDDWQERWKSFHHPVLIEAPSVEVGARSAAVARRMPALHVRAPWQPASAKGDVLEIVIDPGQAFGTGAHPTTRLCLSLMLELVAREGPSASLLDIGTGSGVLAIAGARLGFSPVLALDHDEQSVAAARCNAAANGQQIEVRRLDLRRDPLPCTDRARSRPGGQVMVANLLRPLLLELAQRIPSAPSHLIVGGLLTDQAQEVSDGFGARLGLCERRLRSSGEWSSLWLSAAAG